MKISIKTILPIILISALLILLNGCFGVPDDSPGFNPGSITGRIRVPTDCTVCLISDCIPKSNNDVPDHWIPVEDAIVTVIPHATLTDEDGYYTLGNIEPGVYYVITATFGNLVLKDIVEPPGVKAGETYDAGTANCESTALGLIVEALLDRGLDSEDIELALEIIKVNPKFDDLVDIICCIIEDCGNVTLICGVDELVQDIIDDEPGYTCPPLYQNQSLAIAINNTNPCSDVCATISSITVSYTDGGTYPDFMIIITPSYNDKGLSWVVDSGISFNPANGKVCLNGGQLDTDYNIVFTYTDPCGDSISEIVTVSFKLCAEEECPPLSSDLAIAIDNTNPCSTDCATINSITVSYTDGTADEVITPSYSGKGLSWVTDSGISFNPANGEVCLTTGVVGTNYDVDFTYTDECGMTATGTARVNFDNCDPCYDNDPPVLTVPASLTINAGDTYIGTASATDDGIRFGTDLVFSASIAPSTTNGLTINPSTGAISWVSDCADIEGDALTDYVVTVTVDDGCDPVSDSFTITLDPEVCDLCYDNDPPVLTVPASLTINAGDTYIGTASATDDGIRFGTDLVFSASIAPSTTNGLTINPSTGAISWVSDCADIEGDALTDYVVTVTVDDGCDPVSDSFTITLDPEVCTPPCNVEFQSKATACNNVSSSLTIGNPSGAVKGDFLLAQICYEKGSVADVNTPSGWTKVDEINYETNFGQAIFYRFVSSTTSYTWTFSQEVKAVGGILRFTCVDDTTDPIIDYSGDCYQDDFDLRAPSVNAEDNSMLVGFYALEEYQFNLSTPGGMTQEYQVNCADYSRIMAATEFRTNGGPTGSRTSTTSVDDHWVAHLVAIRGK